MYHTSSKKIQNTDLSRFEPMGQEQDTKQITEKVVRNNFVGISLQVINTRVVATVILPIKHTNL